MIMMSGALPRVELGPGPDLKRGERAAATFQSTMTAQLLKPALPRLVAVFGGRSGGASETMEQFVSQVFSDALAQQLARRDPFGLVPAVKAEIEARASRQNHGATP
ncbi:hypothetical protein [Hyphomonas sp.]|jgi:hypothetical protein|uniref:hypothetical protein n=1 Tax=Hyphomonas sp. TaxID=87 RepID=UPI0037BE9149